MPLSELPPMPDTASWRPNHNVSNKAMFLLKSFFSNESITDTQNISGMGTELPSAS